MKKLIAVPLLSFVLSSFSQSSGIITEKKLSEAIAQNTPSNKYITQRISLTTGVDLEYVEQGNQDGIPVIFLHGVTDSWHSFESTLPFIPGHIHAFALSQRGHGESGKPSNGYTPRHFAADVAAFVEQKKLGPVVIVGHSMGGIVAQQFALDYPNLTKAITIVASDPAISRNEGMPEFYKEVMQMKNSASREYMVAFQKATLSTDIDHAYFNLLVDESMKIPLKVFQAVMTGIITVDYTEQLKTLSRPALIFWGSRDAFFSRAGQETISRNIKGSKWILYEGVGHALHWEQPQRFANDLIDFIHHHFGE